VGQNETLEKGLGGERGKELPARVQNRSGRERVGEGKGGGDRGKKSARTGKENTRTGVTTTGKKSKKWT